MVLLWMWLILQAVYGLHEEKKRAGATEPYVFSRKVAWTPDDIVPSRIVKLSTRIPLALGIWRIPRQRLSLEGLQASQPHSIYE